MPWGAETAPQKLMVPLSCPVEPESAACSRAAGLSTQATESLRQGRLKLAVPRLALAARAHSRAGLQLWQRRSRIGIPVMATSGEAAAPSEPVQAAESSAAEPAAAPQAQAPPAAGQAQPVADPMSKNQQKKRRRIEK